MKLQCLNCEGGLTWFTEYAKHKDFENEFKGFFHAKARGSGTTAIISLGGEVFLTLL